MSDIIERQAAIDAIEYELEMINSALDSITLDFNTRERLKQRRYEAREILNSIQQLPTAQPKVIHCKDCEWWTKSNEYVQGRCDLMQMYSTGKWFCGFAQEKVKDESRTQ
jgi:hypothetical protein